MAYRSTVYFSICSLQMEHRSAASFSIGTNGANRQIVYALPSGVNICSLQMKRRSAASFSIGTNGTNRQIVYARPSGVNICSLQIEHRLAASYSIGAIGINGSIGEGFLTIGICLCILDMCVEFCVAQLYVLTVKQRENVTYQLQDMRYSIQRIPLCRAQGSGAGVVFSYMTYTGMCGRTEFGFQPFWS